MSEITRISKALPYFVVAVVMISYMLVLLFPYQWMVPIVQPNPVQASDNSISFQGIGVARSSEAPAWIADVIATSQFTAHLRATPIDSKQSGPARIFTLSRSHSQRNFTIGQDGVDLTIRMRTMNTDGNGMPEVRISGVFAKIQPVDIRVVVDGSLSVWVNDELRVESRLPDQPLSNWHAAYRIALGNELDGGRDNWIQRCNSLGFSCAVWLDPFVASSDRAWRGVIHEARVEAGGSVFDYLQPGSLHIPPNVVKFPVDPAVFIFATNNLVDLIVNFLGFLPFGFIVAVCLPWRSKRQCILGTTTVALLFSMSVEISQILMSYRYTSVIDILLNSLGGYVGAFVAWRRKVLIAP